MLKPNKNRFLILLTILSTCFLAIGFVAKYNKSIDNTHYMERTQNNILAYKNIVELLEANKSIPFAGVYQDDNGVLHIG
ncbi:MAG: hypothetical protein AB1420_05800 [Bacillota bacterium]